MVFNAIRHNMKQYFEFTSDEVLQVFITALVAGFVLSFRKWGEGDVINIGAGVSNLLLATIFVFIGIYIHTYAQKFVGILLGYSVKYTWWKLGFFVSLFMAFLTNGFFPLFFPGSVDGDAKAKMRVGIYMPRFKFWEFALTCGAGPIMSLLLVFFAQPFYFWIGSEAIRFFIICNLYIMIWSMLPLPLFHGVRVIESGRTAYDLSGGLAGWSIFLGTRAWWLIVFAIMLAYTFLIVVANYFSFLLSILLALVILAVYFVLVEWQRR